MYTCKSRPLAEQLGIHGADEAQPAQNSCPQFTWFALVTPFSMYMYMYRSFQKAKDVSTLHSVPTHGLPFFISNQSVLSSLLLKCIYVC